MVHEHPTTQLIAACLPAAASLSITIRDGGTSLRLGALASWSSAGQLASANRPGARVYPLRDATLASGGPAPIL